MLGKEAKLDLSTVVVVADLVAEDTVETGESDWRHDLEKSSSGTVAAITEAIASLGVRALHLPSLDALNERASQRHPGDIVLSIFGGERSRNRMASGRSTVSQVSRPLSTRPNCVSRPSPSETTQPSG